VVLDRRGRGVEKTTRGRSTVSDNAGGRGDLHVRLDDAYRGARLLGGAGDALAASGRAVARAQLSAQHAGTDIAADAVNAFVGRYTANVSTQGGRVWQTSADTTAAVRGLGEAGGVAARDQREASAGFLDDPARLLGGRS
jgi:hypothetical protein